MKLSTKIITPLAVLSLLALALVAASSWLSNQQLSTAEAIYSEKMVPLDNLRRIQLLFREIEYRIVGVMADTLNPVGAREHLDTTVKELNILWDETRPTIEQVDFSEKINRFTTGFDGFNQFVPTLAAAYDSADVDQVEEANDEWYDYKVLIIRSIDAIVEQQAESVALFHQSEKRRIQKLVTVGLVISIVLVILLSGFGWQVARRAIKSLEKIVRTVNKIERSGDFTLRAEIDSSDEIGQMGATINSLMAALEESIGEANRVSGAIAAGDFSQRIKQDMKGDLETLKQGINHSSDSVDLTMKALEGVMRALANGDFSKRLDEDIKGELKNQVNGAMQSIEEGIGEINRVMEAMVRGDFQQTILVDLQGDMDGLKQNISNTIQTLRETFSDINETASALAQGDLTRNIDKQYQGQIGDLTEALNRALEKLRQMVSKVHDTAVNLNSATAEMVVATQDLSDRTANQAASIEETSSTMEEMSASVQHNAEYTRKANQLADEARDHTLRGGEVITEVVSAMDGINESSNQVAEIIDVIDSIAFQTNLLALNAAVEAARAGEQGRGFAVVASEVRALAQRSASAASEIKELIKESVDRAHKGTELVHDSGETLARIRGSVESVRTIIAEVNTASDEQATGISQVHESVTHLEGIAQQNSAFVEQSSANSLGLSEQSQLLEEMVNGFRIDQPSE